MFLYENFLQTPPRFCKFRQKNACRIRRKTKKRQKRVQTVSVSVRTGKQTAKGRRRQKGAACVWCRKVQSAPARCPRKAHGKLSGLGSEMGENRYGKPGFRFHRFPKRFCFVPADKLEKSHPSRHFQNYFRSPSHPWEKRQMDRVGRHKTMGIFLHKSAGISGEMRETQRVGKIFVAGKAVSAFFR